MAVHGSTAPTGRAEDKQTNEQTARSKPNRASLRIGAHATNGPAPTDCSLIGRSALAYARKLRLESVELVGAGLRRLGRGLEVHQPLPEPNGPFTLGAISYSRVRAGQCCARRVLVSTPQHCSGRHAPLWSTRSATLRTYSAFGIAIAMPCGVRCMYVAVSHRKASGRVPLSHRMIYWSSELQTHHTQVHRTAAPPHQCNAQCCIGVRICRLQIRTDVLRTHTAPEPRAVSWHRNESELAFATARSRHGTARSRSRHGTVTVRVRMRRVT